MPEFPYFIYRKRNLEKIYSFINKSKFAIFNHDFVKEIYEKRI